jgi:hypothetical protein
LRRGGESALRSAGVVSGVNHSSARGRRLSWAAAAVLTVVLVFWVAAYRSLGSPLAQFGTFPIFLLLIAIPVLLARGRARRRDGHSRVLR